MPAITRPSPSAGAPAPDRADRRSAGAPVEEGPVDSRLRLLFRLGVLIAVLPITVAAIRNGMRGWVPTWDAATTTFRVNDVLTSDPPLIGMWSSASHWSGHQINFIGALQLYMLAVPVKLLGNTWGVLLGMAAINTATVAVAAWLVRRRVGYVGGLVGCAFLASLVWALGSEVIVDITPMQMGVLPFALLLVTAWSVADGDLVAVPILAFVANYLLLDHLTYVVTAPLLALWGIVLLVLALRRRRRDDPEGWPVLRRRAIRAVLLAAAITVVVWIPPLIQQFFSDAPPNLSHLYAASKAEPPFSATVLGAASALAATVAVPPMWFRDSFLNTRFLPDGDGRPFVVGLVCSLVLLGLYAAGIWASRRRQDRTMVVGLLTGLFGLLVGFWTVKKSPGAFGLRGNYLHSLWALAAFVWMVLALALVRCWPAMRRWWKGRATAAVALAVAAVFCVLNIPRADLGAGTTAWSLPLARTLADEVVPAVRGQGPVLIRYGGNTGPWAMFANVLLDLQEAGIPIRLEGVENLHQYGWHRAYTPRNPNARSVLVLSSNPKAPDGFHQIAEADPLTADERAELKRLDAQVTAWLERSGKPEVSKEMQARNADFAGGIQYNLDRSLAAASSPADMAQNHELQRVASVWLDEGRDVLLIDHAGIDAHVLQRWGALHLEDNDRHVWVFMAPIAAIEGQEAPHSSPPVNPGDTD